MKDNVDIDEKAESEDGLPHREEYLFSDAGENDNQVSTPDASTDIGINADTVADADPVMSADTVADADPVISADTAADADPVMSADTVTDTDTGLADNTSADFGAGTAENPGFDSSADETEHENGPAKIRMELYDWLQCIVSAVICGIFIFVFIGRTIGVEGDSMRQTLHWNDRIIMSNLFYTPKNGDIIVFRAPSDVFGGTPLVKRVIAVAGQTIDINFDTGEVFVDGVVLDEPYINEPTYNRINFHGPELVPDGYVFVMGDNRNHSSDSRDSRVGMVDTRYILGKVLFIAIPGQDDFSPRDWSRIGLVNGRRSA